MLERVQAWTGGKEGYLTVRRTREPPDILPTTNLLSVVGQGLAKRRPLEHISESQPSTRLYTEAEAV